MGRGGGCAVGDAWVVLAGFKLGRPQKGVVAVFRVVKETVNYTIHVAASSASTEDSTVGQE